MTDGPPWVMQLATTSFRHRSRRGKTSWGTRQAMACDASQADTCRKTDSCAGTSSVALKVVGAVCTTRYARAALLACAASAKVGISVSMPVVSSVL